jgi:hypothetical protein
MRPRDNPGPKPQRGPSPLLIVVLGIAALTVGAYDIARGRDNAQAACRQSDACTDAARPGEVIGDALKLTRDALELTGHVIELFHGLRE